MVSKIVVPSLGAPGPAELALQRFGFAYEARPVDAGSAYSRMLADLWREGDGFLMFEHDVVPTSRDVVTRLLECPEPWCTHAYASPVLMMSIGVLKLTRDALARSQDLPARWGEQHWGTLDSVMVPLLHSCFALHGHYPPCEHHK